MPLLEQGVDTGFPVLTGLDLSSVQERRLELAYAPIAPSALRKRAANFVPRPTDDARIDQRILELMEQQLTVGEIAQNIKTAFPTRFKDRNAALTRVGDVSNRYSTQD